MALTQEDREWVKLIAESLASEVITKVMAQHIESCPVAQKIAVSRAMLIGLLLGAAGLGSSLGAVIEKLW